MCVRWEAIWNVQTLMGACFIYYSLEFPLCPTEKGGGRVRITPFVVVWWRCIDTPLLFFFLLAVLQWAMALSPEQLGTANIERQACMILRLTYSWR